MGCLCFGSYARSNRGSHGRYRSRLLEKESSGSAGGIRSELLSRLSQNLSHLDWNDTTIKRSSDFSVYSRPSTQNNLTYPSLMQIVKYKVGNELICMSWNLNHKPDCSPFDFYSDFRNLDVPQSEFVHIQLLWDVARVFRCTSNPSDFCRKMKLKSVVPSELLSDMALTSYCETVKILDGDRETVMNLPQMTLYAFMLAFTFDWDDDGVFHNDSSFLKTHQRCHRRASNPLQPQYKCDAFKSLLHQDPSLLPILILDSLHALMIRFSSFLLYNNLQKAFSEYKAPEQMEQFLLYSYQNSPSDLSLPRQFVDICNMLWEQWTIVFGNENKVKQIFVKMERTDADIVLLQNVTMGLFRELKSGLSGQYSILPSDFPKDVEKTSIVCLKKGTVLVEEEEEKTINHSNFAVLCKSSDILYYVAVVSLTPGQACGEIRRQEATSFKRLLRKGTPVIIGGYFWEDLTLISNPVARIMLKKYNGIDHHQELAIKGTRTDLQFQVSKSIENDHALDNGIFSSFPFAGDASTDFLYPGLDNPSDCGPIFQRIVCMI